MGIRFLIPVCAKGETEKVAWWGGGREALLYI